MFTRFQLGIPVIQTIFKRYAGHSKWQNIRHTKAAKDMERSRMFIRIGIQMKAAIRENGADPVSNHRLAQIIELAKSKSMPTLTIQNFINQSKKSEDNAIMYFFDLKGPKGSFFIVQAFTSNIIKTRNEIHSAIRKGSLILVDNIRSQFEHKGVVTAKPKSKIDNIQELSIDHAIISGSEEVEYDTEEDNFKFYCSPRDLNHVSKKLEELEYVVEAAEEQFLPQTLVTLDDVQLDSISKIYEKINKIPDVLKIFDNVA